MDCSIVIAAAALALSIAAGLGPTVWGIVKYRKDKRLDYARNAADLYYKAVSKMHYANNPDTATQDIVYASLMLRAAIGHDKEINRATMAAIAFMEDPTLDTETEKTESMDALLPIIGESVKR